MITVLGKDTKLWAIIAIPVLLLLSFPFYFFQNFNFRIGKFHQSGEGGNQCCQYWWFHFISRLALVAKKSCCHPFVFVSSIYLFYSNGEFIIVQLSLFTVLLDF